MGKCVSINKLSKSTLPPAKLTQEDLNESLPEIVSAVVSNKPAKDQSKLMISESLKKHYLFSGLSKEDMESMFTRLKFYEVPSGAVIFEQGSQGKKFYIIESGKLEVYRNNVKKTVLGEGQTFGEMALLTDSKRSATIKTIEDSTLWGIGRTQFRAAIKIIGAKNFQINKEFISNLPIFAHLPDSQISDLTVATVQHDYPDNTRIICEGDEGMLLFIIKSGNAVAKIKGVEKFRITQGEMFGEAVVLGENRIRNISVYTIGPVKLLSIARDSIISIIGENFKESIYKTQAKNSLSSDSHFRMLPKETLHNIVDHMEWVFVKPGELAVSAEIVEESIIVLCLGSISSEEKTYSHFEVVGFNPKLIKAEQPLMADTEVVLGLFKRIDLEKFAKAPWQKLKFELKVMGFLSKIDMFLGVNLSKLRYIASHVIIQEFDKKEVIFRYNEEAHEFYVIKRGSVEITQNGKILRVLGKYDIFGNKCIEEPIRSNSARALGNCLCYVISSSIFRDIMDDSTRSLLLKKKSFLCDFSLNQMIMIKQQSASQFKSSFLTYVEHFDKYFNVKVINKAYFEDAEKFNQVIQEKNITMQMDHPFILKSIKTFSDSRFLYLVHEHVETCTLASLCNKKINEDYTKFLAACLYLILDYLQGKDVILRTLCPQNISINKRGYPCISEFTYAKIVKGRTYTELGDPVYTAPEVYTKSGYGKHIDLWSLGVMIYQFLYNSFPFGIKNGMSPKEIYDRVNNETLSFPADTTHIRGNEIISEILKINAKERLTLNKLRYSRWLDSIDWERLATLKVEPPFKPDFQTHKTNIKLDKFISLPRYLNENINNESLSRKSLKFNWDKHF